MKQAALFRTGMTGKGMGLWHLGLGAIVLIILYIIFHWPAQGGGDPICAGGADHCFSGVYSREITALAPSG